MHQCDGKGRSPWNNVAQILLENGVHVLTFDFRGHGESGGTNPEWSGIETAIKRWRGIWADDMKQGLSF